MSLYSHVSLSTNNATMSGSNAVSASRQISNRLRSCPTHSYASPTSGVKGTKPSTRNPPIQSKSEANERAAQDYVMHREGIVYADPHFTQNRGNVSAYPIPIAPMTCGLRTRGV
jgi:hypothetical protein